MSGYPSTDFYLWFTLNLASREDGSTKTVLITNRHLTGTAISDSDYEHYPILKGVSGAGSAMSDFLPRPVRGSVELRIEPHSLQYERRVLDLFERYTPVEQDLELNYALKGFDAGLADPSSDGTVILTTKVRSWRANFTKNTLTLLTGHNPIREKSLGRILDESQGFTELPDKSKGRTLPIVFGTGVQVKGYPLNTGGDNVKVALATTWNNKFELNAIGSVYVKDAGGVFREVIDGDDSTHVIEDVYSAYTSGRTDFDFDSSRDDAYELPAWDSTTDNYLLSQIAVLATGNGTAPADSESMTITLFPHNDTTGTPTDDPIASATVSLDDYTSELAAAAGNNFWVRFVLDKPIPLAGFTKLYAVHTSSEPGNNTESFQKPDSSGATPDAHNIWRRSTSNPTWYKTFTSTAWPNYRMYGVEFTKSTGIDNPDGLGWGYSRLELKTIAAPTGQELPELQDLDIVAEVDGISDDGSGSITGSAGGMLNSMYDVIKLLDYDLVSNTWTAQNSYDTSTYGAALTNAEDWGLAPVGKTSGRVKLTGVLEDLCYNTAHRIGLRRDGLTLYPMAAPQTSQGTIRDSDCRLITLEARPADQTVVNKFTVNYDESLLDVDLAAAANENDLKQYAGYKLHDEDTLPTEVGVSETLYGGREFSRIRFDFVGSEGQADELIRRYAKLFGRNPVWLVSFDVPLAEYPTIDIFDVYNFVHPKMPAYFGTSTNAVPPTYETGEIETARAVIKRAQPYRIQIESRQLFAAEDAAPYWRCQARVILDDIDPT